MINTFGNIILIICAFAVFGILFMIGWLEDREEAKKRREIERKNAVMKRKKEMTKLKMEIERMRLEKDNLALVGNSIYRKRIP